jgi:hypothetical protein
VVNPMNHPQNHPGCINQSQVVRRFMVLPGDWGVFRWKPSDISCYLPSAPAFVVGISSWKHRWILTGIYLDTHLLYP